MTRIFY